MVLRAIWRGVREGVASVAVTVRACRWSRDDDMCGRKQSAKNVLTCLCFFCQPTEPGWRNWQTQRTQNPPGFGPWGFDSPSRHQIKHQLVDPALLLLHSRSYELAKKIAVVRRIVFDTHPRPVGSGDQCETMEEFTGAPQLREQAGLLLQ